MTALLLSMNPSQQPGMGLATMTNDNRINNDNLETKKSYYRQNQSLAETTISKYNGNSGNNSINNGADEIQCYLVTSL